MKRKNIIAFSLVIILTASFFAGCSMNDVMDVIGENTNEAIENVLGLVTNEWNQNSSGTQVSAFRTRRAA